MHSPRKVRPEEVIHLGLFGIKLKEEIMREGRFVKLLMGDLLEAMDQISLEVLRVFSLKAA